MSRRPKTLRQLLREIKELESQAFAAMVREYPVGSSITYARPFSLTKTEARIVDHAATAHFPRLRVERERDGRTERYWVGFARVIGGAE